MKEDGSTRRFLTGVDVGTRWGRDDRKTPPTRRHPPDRARSMPHIVVGTGGG